MRALRAWWSGDKVYVTDADLKALQGAASDIELSERVVLRTLLLAWERRSREEGKSGFLPHFVTKHAWPLSIAVRHLVELREWANCSGFSPEYMQQLFNVADAAWKGEVMPETGELPELPDEAEENDVEEAKSRA